VSQTSRSRVIGGGWLKNFKRAGWRMLLRLIPRRAGHSRAPQNYGESFSRCGRWSRFQRDKAAALVSSKRNCSVGDLM
jgi:hypothetical protein